MAKFYDAVWRHWTTLSMISLAHWEFWYIENSHYGKITALTVAQWRLMVS